MVPVMPRQETPTIALRAGDEFRLAVEKWAAKQSDTPTLSEAILVELGLTLKTQGRPVSKPGRRLRAAELAAKAIDKIGDSAPPEERAQRRRRLTKGPVEFREVRVVRSKAIK
jgi:hypothetical protein